jgi:hypothetical protein
MALCRHNGCKAYAVNNGLCGLHGAGKAAPPPVAGPVAAAAAPAAVRIKGNGYYGGAANQPHVHVYAGGAHLKLGVHRFNLVQGGKRYSAVDDAYRALGSHPLGGTLRPWVDAALAYFGV